VAGRQAAIGAIRATGKQRRTLEARAYKAVAHWVGLERGFDAAERTYDREAMRTAVSGMEAFATKLKSDQPLDSLLRQRGEAFGIQSGSRLDQVVRGAGWTRDLAYQLNLGQGLRQGRGLGLSL
jgi:hypothetical protein